MNEKNTEINTTRVVQAGPISPHSKAIYEAGKAMLIDSLETSRKYCKSMISTSIGAIPTYLGILAFILPEHYSLGKSGGWTVAIPAFGFLMTSLVFTLGYLPISGDFSLDIIEEIENQRNKVLKWRKWIIWAGSALFTLSMIWGICVVVVNIGVK